MLAPAGRPCRTGAGGATGVQARRSGSERAMASEDLFEAIRANDAARVRALLSEDEARAAARNAGGVSAVLHACYHGRPQLARLLVEHGAPVDVFEAAALGDT